MAFTDSDLIARVLARQDQHAFAELVRRYQSPVRAFLRRLTRGDAPLADDLAQETFLKAWQGLQTYRGASQFSTWLFGIAFNEFRSAARRRQELALADVDEPPLRQEAAESEPAHALRLDLTAALDTLSVGERAAIVLCCQNGLSHADAAQVLACPLGTVKTNVLRGKEKLRQCLALDYKEYASA